MQAKTTIELARIFLTRSTFSRMAHWKICKTDSPNIYPGICMTCWTNMTDDVGSTSSQLMTLDKHLANWCNWTDEQNDVNPLVKFGSTTPMLTQRMIPIWSTIECFFKYVWMLKKWVLWSPGLNFICLDVLIYDCDNGVLNYHFTSGKILIICIFFPSACTCSR